MTSRSMGILLTVLLISAAAAPARSARAQQAAAVDPQQQQTLDQIVELNRKAVGEHQAGRHAEAQKLLGEALALAATQGLGTHDMAARTHVHLGIVAIAGLQRRDEGLRYFAEARRIKPGIKLTRSLSTPALEREFRAARRVKLPPATQASVSAPPVTSPPAGATEARNKEPIVEKDGGGDIAQQSTAGSHPAGSAAANQDEPDVPVNVPQPLYCPTPIEGPPDADVKLHCLTQADVSARKIVLYYRPSGGERYTAVTMNRTPKGWFSAVVPAKQVTGRALQFYFEARGESNRVSAANGKDELPNVIMLKPGAPPVGVGALAALTFDGGDSAGAGEATDEETPLQMREKEEVRQAEVDSIDRRAAGKFWAGLGVGSGWGWHLNRPLERNRNRQVTTGFSPAGLAHATPELGYQVTPRLAISLQGRHQYIPTSGSGDPLAGRSPPETAHAILLRAQFVLASLGDLQFLGSAAAGYGSALRMKVSPAPEAGLPTSDTIVAGPGVAGPGLGVAYNFTNRILAIIEARALAGLPKFGVMVEGAGGLQYAF